MPYIVNSSPEPGYRYEPGRRFVNAVDALLWAAGLSKRGMRLIRIIDTVSGKIYEEGALRSELKGGQNV